ncbi:hypothetical protein [Streptomyces sp. WMMB303]|uniref:hypothetical protein n=1 Tax=Streptomyces sp. WMMB303 TaxID=3034154 RepID=UPI0023ECFAB6|nr:hypothetical protein [Streptomyces sp. WMMB303]MDF4253993.1 hypothetical protein [Streptomyces sp. WMMB303]
MGDGTGRDDINWNTESLNLIENGLNGAIEELRASGGDATDALQGAGFEELALTGMEMGHHELSVGFEDFCEQWEWGIRALVQNANALAQRLGLSAGMAYEEDQYAAGALKIGLNSLTGNPHATEEEIINSEWGDLVAPYKPDYSMDSLRQARADIGQDWQDTGRALTAEGRGGMYTDWAQNLTGVSDEEVEAQRVAWFGPSPEERATAAQPENEGGRG